MGKRSRRILVTLLILVAVGAGITAAFWPRPLLVDLGTVTEGPLVVTVNEDGRTRVRDAYVVSTPIAGRLMRVNVSPGDAVIGGESVVAQMMPTNPAALDIRTREQAHAAVTAAEAALRVAVADRNKSLADMELSESDLRRAQTLFESGTVAQAALDRAESVARASRATRDTAEAAIAMREAEVQNARAQLIGFDDTQLANAMGLGNDPAIPVKAPITGRILRIMETSETTLPVGAPILEIGDVESDLEVVVDLLSTDAVQVSQGDRVIITNWGGERDLAGTVARVDPLGFTKVSALGVEEQRVNAVIQFDNNGSNHGKLGHGFRVEARIVIWEAPMTTLVPTSALFREVDAWSVFTVIEGIASRQTVEIGRQTPQLAQVLDGLKAGAQVVLYPPAGLVAGQRVAPRVLE